MSERPYNFAAGPAILPLPVLLKAREELTDWHGKGMSVMEMTHRGSAFAEIFAETQERMRRLLLVPESHEILFLQGGATAQFAAVPMNLLPEGKTADYAVTGNFSGIAAKEARKYGAVNVGACMKDNGHSRIPSQQELSLTPDAAYFHYCANNTIYGTAWDYIPDTGRVPLVCDMSSEIMSHPVPVSRYGLIYAGAQKNMAPAGLTVVIVDKALAGHERAITPQVMSYAAMIDGGSMLNTPPCWCIYILGLVLEWLEAQGGVAEMERRKKSRSALIYDVLDNSRLYIPHAEKSARSDMNITFRTASEETDAEFVKGAAARGLLNLKGHRLTGGMRASLYNAMPQEGAAALAEYMKEFEVSRNV
ncbi:MAG: 3-phosphoserine/phosphohydroxythreonine transaminase [Oscillospiraceae bacterium]